MAHRVYLETSVISYLAAEPSRDLVVAAHQQLTREWWDTRRADFDLFVSEVVVDEATRGNPQMSARRMELIREVPRLAVTPEALSLAEMLVEKGGIPRKAFFDAVHVAVAAVNGMDFLLTWNCKHIANARIRNRIGVACRESGFDPPVISTPEELGG